MSFNINPYWMSDSLLFLTFSLHSIYLFGYMINLILWTITHHNWQNGWTCPLVLWRCLSFDRICLFSTTTYQHCLISSLNPSGHDDGTGKCKLLLPTPQIIAEESTSLYGISPDNNSHNTTPNDLKLDWCAQSQNIWEQENQRA
jgi:hypothetical protein